jgi:hypothetical protein
MIKRDEQVIKLPVTISGRWLDPPNRDWQRLATAPEPIVALVFLKHGKTLEWCKSERARRDSQEVRLALFPYDETGLEIQVNFSTGGGRLWASVVESPTYKPSIQEVRTVETGKVAKFVTVEGNPVVDLSLMFLASHNVQVGRRGIWHLKPEVVTSMPPRLVTMLTRGRTGKDLIDEELMLILDAA